MESLANCPVCQSESLKQVFKTKDYFLTNEEFEVVECNACKLRFTNPRPEFGEILKFYDSTEYISHDTSKKNLLTRIYKVARSFMLKKKYSIVKSYAKGNKVLDVGCGSGEFLNFCRSKGAICFGVELNTKPREHARNVYGLDVRGKLNEFSVTEFQFDCITLWHVMEHIHDLKNTINLLKEHLKPEGILIIALPNFSSWDAEHYKEFWAAYDLPRHLYHFNKFSFKIFAATNHFKILDIIPQKLDSYYISLLSEKYKFGKSKIVRAILNGAYSNLISNKKERGHSSLIYILSQE